MCVSLCLFLADHTEHNHLITSQRTTHVVLHMPDKLLLYNHWLTFLWDLLLVPSSSKVVTVLLLSDSTNRIIFQLSKTTHSSPLPLPHHTQTLVYENVVNKRRQSFYPADSFALASNMRPASARRELKGFHPGLLGAHGEFLI